MALLPLLLTALPLLLAPQDLAEDLATLGKERDDASAEVVQRIAATSTREAAEGLVGLYEGMASVWMRREILRALPRFDGSKDAEQVALDHLFTMGQTTDDPILEPSAGEIFDALVPRYLETQIYNLALESLTSEYASRRFAMKNATEAATDMQAVLKGMYNRKRQEGITTELLDIVGGAAAVAS